MHSTRRRTFISLPTEFGPYYASAGSYAVGIAQNSLEAHMVRPARSLPSLGIVPHFLESDECKMLMRSEKCGLHTLNVALLECLANGSSGNAVWLRVLARKANDVDLRNLWGHIVVPRAPLTREVIRALNGAETVLHLGPLEVTFVLCRNISRFGMLEIDTACGEIRFDSTLPYGRDGVDRSIYFRD